MRGAVAVEVVTKLVPSAVADSVCFASDFPAPPCGAFTCRHFCGWNELCPPVLPDKGFVTASIAVGDLSSIYPAANEDDRKKKLHAGVEICGTSRRAFRTSCLVT